VKESGNAAPPCTISLTFDCRVFIVASPFGRDVRDEFSAGPLTET